MMRPAVLIVAVAAGLGVAACGSSGGDRSATGTAPLPLTRSTTVPGTPRRIDTYSPTTTSVASTPSSPATVTTATITQPDSGGAGLTTGTAAAAAECTAPDLTVAAVPPNGATGTVVLGFTLTNTGAQACETYGWPGVTFVDSAGNVVTTLTTRTTSDILGSTPPTRFSIASGGEASFRVTVRDSNADGGEGGCGSYSHLQVIAPNDTSAMAVKLPDGAVDVCGAAQISPLEPGSSATGQ